LLFRYSFEKGPSNARETLDTSKEKGFDMLETKNSYNNQQESRGIQFAQELQTTTEKCKGQSVLLVLGQCPPQEEIIDLDARPSKRDLTEETVMFIENSTGKKTFSLDFFLVSASYIQ
jgi:hypothetical protein